MGPKVFEKDLNSHHLKMAIVHAAYRPRNIFRSHRLAIMEANAIAQMKYPRQRIRPFPTRGKPRLQIEVLILVDQRVVDQRTDTLGLRIRSLSQIKVVR